MEIMFTSSMGTEKRSRELSVGIVSCNPPKKKRVQGVRNSCEGMDNVRFVIRRPRPFLYKRMECYCFAIGERMASASRMRYGEM